MGKKKKIEEQREALDALARPKNMGLAEAKAQLKTAAKVAGIFLLVVWLLTWGFVSGLDSIVPVFVAATLTVAVGIAALLIVRNLKKSESIGALLTGGAGLSDEQRTAELAKLEAKAEKGDAGALMAKAQLKMNESPKDALEILEKIDLEKAQKLIAMQVRTMRAMLHLNLGDLSAARALAEAIDLKKAPDPKSRANFAAVVAEAWARSGNPIEANELLDKYDPEGKEFDELRVQLYRARVFACAHKNDLAGMKKALKNLTGISPQLAGMFVGQKRVHPLLEQEARRLLEKSGFGPKQRIQGAR